MLKKPNYSAKPLQKSGFCESNQDWEFHDIVAAVVKLIEKKGLEEIPVNEMHNIMEQVLEDFNPAVAKSYRDYRNYKKDFIHMMDEVYIKSQSIRFIGDKENAKVIL